MTIDWDEKEEDERFRFLPKRCKHKDDGNGNVQMSIPSKTDLWRRDVKNGYVKENAPYYFRKVKGDFQVSVKVNGNFSSLFDQAGILIRQNRETYLKCGVEIFTKNRQLLCHASTTVTKKFSDWSTVPLAGDKTSSYWFVVRRIGNCVESYSSSDGVKYNQIRLALLFDQEKISVGMYGASPQGSGLKVKFEHFNIQQEEEEAEEAEADVFSIDHSSGSEGDVDVYDDDDLSRDSENSDSDDSYSSLDSDDGNEEESTKTFSTIDTADLTDKELSEYATEGSSTTTESDYDPIKIMNGSNSTTERIIFFEDESDDELYFSG